MIIERSIIIENTKFKLIVPISFLIPLILEYFVIINLYNGIIPNIPEAIEYSLMDVIVLLIMLISTLLKVKQDLLELIIVFLCFIAHIQWYVHNPFEPWPEWWIAEQSEGDERHRTEWYDTHVMVFACYLILFLRRFPIN